jgi:hypothetical protein
LESAISFAEIMKMEDLNLAANVLSSYDWDIEVPLHHIKRAIISIDLNGSPSLIQEKGVPLA